MTISRRRWTKAEDAAVRAASLANATEGLTDEHGRYHSRLKTLAEEMGRTYPAVRIRARKLKAASFKPRTRP